MEKIHKFRWRPIYAAYMLACLSFIALFFAADNEAAFSNLLQRTDMAEITIALSLHKLLLALLDLCLLIIAVSPLQREDERTEKIRSFALKNSFLLSMVVAIYAGLLINFNISFLVYVPFVLVYYIAFFRLCLYYDPVFVYMTDEQLKVHYAKLNRKFFIYFAIQLSVVNAATNIICEKYNRPELFWGISLLNIYVMLLVRTIYYTWKG